MSMTVIGASKSAASKVAKGWDAQQILAGRLERIGKNYPRQMHLAGGAVRIELPHAIFDEGQLRISARVETTCLTGTVTKESAKAAAKELLTQVVEDARARIKAAGLPRFPIVVDLDIRTTSAADAFEMP